MHGVSRGKIRRVLQRMTYRHGKGQTYIEPFVDVYTRCRVKWNLIFTDPKGELLAKFYYSLSKRQYEVVQFNLLNPNLTNQFNPLINALQEFRQNNDVEGQSQVDSLANIIFVESENSKGVNTRWFTYIDNQKALRTA